MPQCKFFLAAKAQLRRDYILLVDRSGSMLGDRWGEAGRAVAHLAPHICQFDPDGVSVYFFDHEVVHVPSVTSADHVQQLFDSYRPRGSTDLARALDRAFQEHFSGSRGATTILVITDGCPNSKGAVETVIRKAARSILRDEELSVSFIQIGGDRGAARFLKDLDDNLEARFDIVDTLAAGQLGDMSFNELVANSLFD